MSIPFFFYYKPKRKAQEACWRPWSLWTPGIIQSPCP